ncbi:pseudouridine synthase [Spiroplasma turonicum]|uniref:RNA pseudouridylate synthase n=1 Tax=Spiroplasma turonicum TaxID=216946 RepID=A0A0K1P4Y0_9MOLU|nr:RluA family pseudouridine synthase [Spiroplasma turonicum]AKU79353.1 ribosomal large subunit pseudouridine synthase C [Spiroplasma turonicum]ALX70374.1 ribosomal large subunit pseudouridine synthase C [Spiroplasma turonicum]
MAKFNANINDANQTLLKFVKKVYKNTNLSIIYKWFRKGKIKVNDKKIKDLKYIVKENDIIDIYDKDKPIQRDSFIPIDYSSLNVLYEDENVLIVDKDQNIEIHSPVNICLDMLVKSYLFSKNNYIPDNENSYVVSHVHRIDKLTRGIVIYAKNKMAHTQLIESINDKSKIKKLYLVKTNTSNIPTGLLSGFLTYDNFNKRSFFSETNINPNKYKKVQQINQLINNEEFIYEVQILTGRKHQIRAIFSFYNSPIFNDLRYGARKQKEDFFGLIAYKVEFNNLQGNLKNLNGLIIESNFTF